MTAALTTLSGRQHHRRRPARELRGRRRGRAGPRWRPPRASNSTPNDPLDRDLRRCVLQVASAARHDEPRDRHVRHRPAVGQRGLDTAPRAARRAHDGVQVRGARLPDRYRDAGAGGARRAPAVADRRPARHRRGRRWTDLAYGFTDIQTALQIFDGDPPGGPISTATVTPHATGTRAQQQTKTATPVAKACPVARSLLQMSISLVARTDRDVEGIATAATPELLTAATDAPTTAARRSTRSATVAGVTSDARGANPALRARGSIATSRSRSTSATSESDDEATPGRLHADRDDGRGLDHRRCWSRWRSSTCGRRVRPIDVANRVGDLVREASRRAVALGPVRSDVVVWPSARRRGRGSPRSR